MDSNLTYLKLDDLAEAHEAGFDNPRQKFDANEMKQLAADINEEDLMYPLAVWQTEIEGKKYNVVVDGERRRRAIALVIEQGMDRAKQFQKGIACRPIKAESLKDAKYRALAGNIHREDLTTYEIAQEISRLKAMGESQKTISERLHKSETWVSRKISAFEAAAPALKKAWKSGSIPDDTVEDIAELETKEEQETEVEKQLKLRDSGRAGAAKARKSAKKKAKKLSKASTKEIQSLLMYAEQCEKDQRYVRGMLDMAKFVLGSLEEDDFDSEFKKLRKEIDKEAEAKAKAAEKGAKEWAEASNGKGKKAQAEASA